MLVEIYKTDYPQVILFTFNIENVKIELENATFNYI